MFYFYLANADCSVQIGIFGVFLFAGYRLQYHFRFLNTPVL